MGRIRKDYFSIIGGLWVKYNWVEGLIRPFSPQILWKYVTFLVFIYVQLKWTLQTLRVGFNRKMLFKTYSHHKFFLRVWPPPIIWGQRLQNVFKKVWNRASDAINRLIMGRSIPNIFSLFWVCIDQIDDLFYQKTV